MKTVTSKMDAGMAATVTSALATVTIGAIVSSNDEGVLKL